MNINKPFKVRKARVSFNDEKDVLLLRAVLNQDPWRKGDKQWTKVVDEIQEEFEEIVTVRTVRGRLKTLIKNFTSNELQYKSGVAEEEDSEIINILRIIIAIEEEEKAAAKTFVQRKTAEVAGNVPKEVVGNVPKMVVEDVSQEIAGNIPQEVAGNVPQEVSGDVPKEVAGNVPKEVAGNVPLRLARETARVVVGGAINNFNDADDEPPRLSAAKQRRLERDEADIERQLYLDEASGLSTSRMSRQRITKEEELINQRLELDILIEKRKLAMQQEELEAEKIRAMKREEHKMQMEKSKFESEKQCLEEKLHLEKERLALEKLRESRKEKETERRDEISKMSIGLQSKMMDMMNKFLDK